MTCEHVKELIADDLTDTLSAAARAEFHAHLADCRGCAEEAESLRETWRSLGLLEPEQPSSALPSRFYQSLAAYRQGLNQAAIPAENQFREARRAWWSRQPVFQFAFSCTLLVVGAAVGHLLTLNH